VFFVARYSTVEALSFWASMTMMPLGPRTYVSR